MLGSDTLGSMNVTLTTTGRRTGKPRAVPLYAWEDADRLVIVGSLGGSAKDPAWVRNLRADPRATIKKGRQVLDVRASEVEGSDRDRLWKLVVPPRIVMSRSGIPAERNAAAVAAADSASGSTASTDPVG